MAGFYSENRRIQLVRAAAWLVLGVTIPQRFLMRADRVIE
jgi:hypothetical protein